MDPALNKKSASIWSRNFTCAILANLFLCLAHFSVNTLVATYATYLGAAPVLMGFLTGMFFAVALAIRPISGPLITKVDKRLLMIVVFALGGFVNVGYAMFHTIPAFVFFRFLNGVQYSFVGALIMTVAGDSLPEEKMASGMGIYGVGGAVGTAAGPSIGYVLKELGTKISNEGLGFTFVFLFAAVVLTAAVIPSVLMRPDAKTKEDIKSTGAWYKNIVTVYALPTTIVLFFISLSYALYNSYIFNLAAEQNIPDINYYYVLMAGVLVISRPMSGFLTDRFGLSKVVVPGMILFAVSFLIVGSSRTLGMILLGAVIAALGVGSTQPALQAMCIQSVSPLKRSVASNTLFIGTDLALFCGPLFGSVVYKYSSYALMFKTGAIPIVIGLVCFIIILPVYAKRRRELNTAAVHQS